MEFVVAVGTLLLVTALGLFLGFRVKKVLVRALFFALAGLCLACMVLLALNVENSGGGTRVPPKSSALPPASSPNGAYVNLRSFSLRRSG